MNSCANPAVYSDSLSVQLVPVNSTQLQTKQFTGTTLMTALKQLHNGWSKKLPHIPLVMNNNYLIKHIPFLFVQWILTFHSLSEASRGFSWGCGTHFCAFINSHTCHL